MRPRAAQEGSHAQGLAPAWCLKARRACTLASPGVPLLLVGCQDPHLSNCFSSKTRFPNVGIHRDSVCEQMKEAAAWLKLGGWGTLPCPLERLLGLAVCRDLRTPHLGLWESAIPGWLCPSRP